MDNFFKWLVISLCFLPPLAAFATEGTQPFWKTKADVYKRIKEDRAVIVSAKTSRKEGGEKTISLITAGRIKAPLYFTYDITTDYGRYQKILPYVDETSFDKETGKLFASGSFMGWHAKMTMKLASEEGGSGKNYIRWEILSGFLTGMKGVITEERVSDAITEVSMEAKYQGPVILPGFLMSWGFEFIGQKMASAMRSFVESEWEKEK